MQGKEKCLSIEEKDLLLWVAQNGAFLSNAKQHDYVTICKLVASGHLFHGQSFNANDDACSEEAYFSLTKKGFSVLECNFLWETYCATNAHPHVVAHVNGSKLECEQTCLHKRKQISGELIKIFEKVSIED